MEKLFKMSAFAGGPDAPISEARYSELMEAERRLEGLEGRVRDIADHLRSKGADPAPCDDYHRGYKFACRGIAAVLRAALKAPPSAPVPAADRGEPGMLTAEQGWQAIERLITAGYDITIEPRRDVLVGETYVCIGEHESADPESLRAFSLAYAAFEAAIEKDEIEE